MQWKLTHKNGHDVIENEGGKTLSYNANLGIKIIEDDGYAFKDLNGSGVLEPYEDWRLSMTQRVDDFTKRFHLWQENDCLYYKRGKIAIPQEFYEMINQHSKQDQMLQEMAFDYEDVAYLKNNYLIVLLLMMFDNDYDTGKEDYLLSLIVQSMDLGLLENIVYSLWEAIKRFMNKQIIRSRQNQSC